MGRRKLRFDVQKNYERKPRKKPPTISIPLDKVTLSKSWSL
jgi:hypothetical protein